MAEVLEKKEGAGEKSGFHIKMPHIFVLLFGLIVVAAIMTWIVPAGQFDRAPIEGTMVEGVVAGTYHTVEQNPQGIIEVFSSIMQGLCASANICFMILISGGCFAIINGTGAIENGLGVFLSKVNKAKIPSSAVLWIVTFLFSAFGIMVGPEIQIPFTVISVAIALGLGYDLIVGLGMIVGGGFVGFATPAICPSTVGNAQIIAGLPYFSGAELRWVFWLVCTVLTCIILNIYANRVKKNPDRSYVKGIDTTGLGFSQELDTYKLSKQQIGVLLVFLCLFIAFVVGPTELGWYIDQISAALIIAALISAIICGFGVNNTIDIFLKGASGMVMPAFTVGLGRAIQIILENGMVLDTIVNTLSSPLISMGTYGAGVVMIFLCTILNFLIPSGSGMAAAITPILFPIGDMAGLTRQAVVFAFQVGAGFGDMAIPTLGALMAMCGLAHVPFEKWFKFAWKLVLILTLVGVGFMLYAVYINYGPF